MDDSLKMGNTTKYCDYSGKKGQQSFMLHVWKERLRIIYATYMKRKAKDHLCYKYEKKGYGSFMLHVWKERLRIIYATCMKRKARIIYATCTERKAKGSFMLHVWKERLKDHLCYMYGKKG